LLHFATLRQPVRVDYRRSNGAVQSEVAILVDVFTQNGAEWLLLATGQVIRLDALEQVDMFRVDQSDGHCAV
jgi:hypothetical protein